MATCSRRVFVASSLAMAGMLVFEKGALAEGLVDFSQFTTEQLFEIQAQLDGELVQRGAYARATLGAGTYTVGVDIPAGAWSYTPTVGMYGSSDYTQELSDAFGAMGEEFSDIGNLYGAMFSMPYAGDLRLYASKEDYDKGRYEWKESYTLENGMPIKLDLVDGMVMTTDCSQATLEPFRIAWE